MVKRGGARVQVLVNFLLAPKREIIGLYLLVRCRAEKKERGVRLKKLSAVKNKKMELDSLLNLFTQMKLERKQENDVCLLRNRSVH